MKGLEFSLTSTKIIGHNSLFGGGADGYLSGWDSGVDAIRRVAYVD
jgi:hypothetical protein